MTADQFIGLLCAATQKIDRVYFQLPVAGKEDPSYRERVYCYELYHQLRNMLDSHGCGDHVLSGEIDKSSHPIIRKCSPDFVFHEPGETGGLVVVEVKPINAAADGIKKDLDNLEYFTSPEVQYEKGVWLVYGDGDIDRFRGAHKERDQGIRLLWHQYCGVAAQMIG